jgi:hypothetical protein
MAFNLDYVIWDLAVCIVTLLLDILYGIAGHVIHTMHQSNMPPALSG